MIRNYFIAAVRFFYRNRGFTLINVFGLALGIACAVLIFLYVFDELRFDRHHENADRIYLVIRDGHWEGEDYQSGWTTPPMAPAMKEDFPEIESYTRLALWGDEFIFQYGDEKFAEKFVIAADSSVFDVFSIPFIQGDPNTALTRPRCIVLTESTAKKYFGDEDAVGKVLKQLGRDREFEITGVVADQPKQSHFYFDLMYSMNTFGDYASSNAWFNHTFTSYLLLKEGQDPDDLNAKFDDFIARHIGPFLEEAAGITLEEFKATGDRYEFSLQPLKDVHLSQMVNEEHGTKSFIYVLAGIAGIIMLIACINYMNLSTAMAINRSREVGIRKVVGASRGGLIRQFLGESFLLSLVAFCLGMLLVEISIPLFNELTDKAIGINYFSHVLIIPSMILFVMLLALLAGFYPALLLSGFKPVLVLKSMAGEKTKKGGYWLRNFLVLFQFSTCIVIIIGTMAVSRQLHFMQDKDLGFDKEQVLVLHRASGVVDNFKIFKEELLRFPEIKSVSYSGNTPARSHNQQGHHVLGDEKHIYPSIYVTWADHDYLEVMGLKLTEGRLFNENLASDRYSVIINEAAKKTISREGVSTMVFDESPGPAVDSIDYTVIGVVEDFHFQALNHDIGPWIIYLLNEDVMRMVEYVNIKLGTTDIATTLTRIEDEWKKYSDNYPFEYSFLDDDFNLLFKKEARARKMFTVFSILAIIIACMGLLGLAAFTANQKTKQIGIRKALGSTSMEVQILLSKQFSKWVLFAAVIAWPVSWFALRKWFQNYSYHIDMPWGIFILAALLALTIALITVSYHSWRVASRNPAESLKYE